MSAVSKSVTLECHESLASTQTRAAELAKEGVSSALVVSLAQTAGRGRRTREWKSELGAGIYFSVLFRPSMPTENTYLVNIVAALAVADAVESVLGIELRIKWPNDLLIEDASGEWGKVCGILSESAFKGSSLDYCVTGIGINLRSPENVDNFPVNDFPVNNFRIKAGWLFRDSSPDEKTVALLLSGVLSSFFDGIDALATGPDCLLEEYREKCVSIGRIVSVETEGEKLTGLCVGVGSGGELLLETDAGVRGFYVGDVVHATVMPK